jgi:hypothetical protein
VSRVVDAHRQYLADRPRVEAFRQAIGATVRPGDVVLDLGAGTGILGLLAAEAGAGRVYSVEATSLVGLTRQISAANGWRDRFVSLREFSTSVELPEKVDVVVGDQIGRFGFEAGVFEYFVDVRERLLKPEGITIPRSVSLWAAPVQHDEMWANVDFWSRPVAGFDMTPAREIAVNTGYPIRLEPANVLGAPVQLLTADPGERVLAPWRMSVSMTCERTGTVHGIGGWFSAELAPQVTMSNSPLDPARIDRRNVFLPIDRPVPVEAGDRVDVQLQVNPYELVLAWEVTVSGPDGGPRASSSHSTWKGMLLSTEDLRRTSPGFVPHLTPRGHARQTVLELCNGEASLADIQDGVFRRHPELFRTEREAQLFVAEVVTRYAT